MKAKFKQLYYRINAYTMSQKLINISSETMITIIQLVRIKGKWITQREIGETKALVVKLSISNKAHHDRNKRNAGPTRAN